MLLGVCHKRTYDSHEASSGPDMMDRSQRLGPKRQSVLRGHLPC